MKVRISITGTSPLILHNVRLANPLDPIAKAIKVITGKRGKTDDDLAQIARLEFEGGLYLDSQVGPYIPGANVEKCLVEGARLTKSGKQVERGLFVLDNVVPLAYRGPRDVDALWDNESFRSMMVVRVGMQRVVRCRPIFPEWSLDADAEIDPGLLDTAKVGQIASDAGFKTGLGDFRPRYGRFVAQVQAL